MSPDDDGGEGTWWEHAVNALASGYDVYNQRKNAATAQRNAELETRRKQRVKNLRVNAGFNETEAKPVRRRVKKPEEPCCDGPARKPEE
jgi:hypothetical protein